MKRHVLTQEGFPEPIKGTLFEPDSALWKKDDILKWRCFDERTSNI
jgi:hypothetical protein